jgi:LuxR family transcriptional regulator, maltose regulon positive regulatory protein
LEFPALIQDLVYNDYVIGLLPTKFYFPPIPSGFVARPQLLRKLDAALTHRLTLVSAPAGAGKTILVSAWVQSAWKKGAAFGWLSLDAADNDPGRFLEYLGSCLEEGGTVIDIDVLPNKLGELEKILAIFIQGLMDLTREVILVLDDYHLIHNKQIHAALQYFLDRSPAHLHIIVLTRSDPPLELARLRVAGQLVELRMDDLRFSAQEAGEFLEHSAGLKIANDDVHSLNSRAEGWIAGLQMAAISLRGAKDPPAFIAAFAGSHRYVFDYLIEQVLDRQTPEVREFLLRTSILERLSAPLCDAVTGTGGTARGMLSAIERANLFLVPLDDEHGWYRYHHLFSDLLKLVLEQSHPGFSVELHHLASHWYEAQGYLSEALNHALVAKDMELVANIVSKNVLVLVDLGEIVPTLAQIDAIPAEQRASLPWLDVAYAWALAYIGQNDRADTSLAFTEQHMEGLESIKRNKLLGHIASVRAYLAWTNGDQSEEAVAFAEKADRFLPKEELAVRALNLTTLGNSLIQISDDPRAADVLEQALKLAKQAGQSHVVMQASSGLAYAYMVLGKNHQAQIVCEKAIEIADAYQRRNVRPLKAVASVYTILSRIWLESGDVEKAIQIAYKGMALSELWGQFDTIMMCSEYLAYALAIANQGDEAREILRSARKIAQKGPPWHLQILDMVEFEIYLDSDQQEDGEIQRAATYKQESFDKLSSFAEVRVLLKQNRPAEALTVLEQASVVADKYGNYRKVRLFALQALAYFQNQDHASALHSIKLALELAEPENRVITFVREGAAMEKLLRLAHARAIAPAFVKQILSAFESRRKQSISSVRISETLVDPLSDRELEVLRNLNSYLSTPEIAERLVVSANTVRTHIKNIYGKLGVHGRSGAVRRATELGLLA